MIQFPINPILNQEYSYESKTWIWDGVSWNLKPFQETDPIFNASQAKNITATHISVLNNTSGTNTGDQDLSTIESNISSLLNEREITKESTGFTNNRDIVVTYNSSSRTITLNGNFEAYWKGNLIPEITDGWTSPAHDTVEQSYYLYYCDNGIMFANTPWNFDCMMIAFVQYNSHKMAIKETHGFMPWEVHRHLHQTVGSYRLGGGNLTNYTLGSTTNRRPYISALSIMDEDIEHTINPLINLTYTWRYLSGNAVRTLSTGNLDIINYSGRPFYNQNNGGVWGQAQFSNNDYGAIFVVGIPTTSDSESQLYRYMFVQPQTVSQSLVTIQNITPSSLVHGDSSMIVSEFVFFAKIIVKSTATNWTIEEVNMLTGTKVNQISSPSGNFLSIVNHDETLIGSGNSFDPLKVSNPSTGTNTGDETSETIKSKLGISVLSGANTGDQDLSGFMVELDYVGQGATQSVNRADKADSDSLGRIIHDTYALKDSGITPPETETITLTNASPLYTITDFTAPVLIVTNNASTGGEVYLSGNLSYDKSITIQVFGNDTLISSNNGSNTYQDEDTVFASFEESTALWFVTDTEVTVIPDYSDMTVDVMLENPSITPKPGYIYVSGTVFTINTLVFIKSTSTPTQIGVYKVFSASAGGSNMHLIAAGTALHTVRVKDGDVWYSQYDGKNAASLLFKNIGDGDKQLAITKQGFNGELSPVVYPVDRQRTVIGYKLGSNATDFSVTINSANYTKADITNVVVPVNTEIKINDISISAGNDTGNVVLILK